MIGQEPKHQCTDCYFCLVNTSRYNKKNKCKIDYPSVPSAIRPVPLTAEFPGSVFIQLPSLEDLNHNEEL